MSVPDERKNPDVLLTLEKNLIGISQEDLIAAGRIPDYMTKAFRPQCLGNCSVCPQREACLGKDD
ncbi:MAG: hypothetical protein FWG40_03025 [Peptococcaceae bacterium]|nr:hypothetical protein [Peptococcaceae bacterium]